MAALLREDRVRYVLTTWQKKSSAPVLASVRDCVREHAHITHGETQKTLDEMAEDLDRAARASLRMGFGGKSFETLRPLTHTDDQALRHLLDRFGYRQVLVQIADNIHTNHARALGSSGGKLFPGAAGVSSAEKATLHAAQLAAYLEQERHGRLL